MIHGLGTDRALAGAFPRLPGPAALVRHTPLESEPTAWLHEAGFVGAYLQKLGELPNFEHDGRKMREVMAVAWKPGGSHDVPESAHAAVYRGPFAEVIDDDGRRYPRGERVPLDQATLARLAHGPLADQLVFIRDRTAR
jgi:hypothetical protein